MNLNLKVKNKKGFSLIEIIVAVTVFSLSISSIATMVLGAYGSNFQAKLRDKAHDYAVQGIEAVRSIKEQGFNLLADGNHGLTDANGYWEFSGTSDDLNPFTRVIKIEDVYRDANGDIATSGDLDLHTKKATSQVSWQTIYGVANNVTLVAYLTNWRSKEWTQTDWSGGSGQSIWSDNTKFASETNIDYSTAGEIKLKGAGCTGYTWPFDTPGNYNYDSNKIEVISGYAQLKNSAPSNWWDSNYIYRQQITITNNNISALPSGYSVDISLDHYSLVSAGKSLSSGDDVRIVYWNGSSNVELDRVNETVWNTNGTNADIWFKTQASIAGSGTDNNYYVYYGYAGAGTPPTDKNNVYAFFDGFESGNLDNWTDQILDWSDMAVSGTYDTTGNANDVFKVGNTVYLVTQSNSGSEFYIIDVAMPSSPVLLGSLDLGTNANAVYVSGNYAYIAVDGLWQKMLVVDISNPINLSIVGSFDAFSFAYAQDVFVAGNYAYLVTTGNFLGPEFYVLDISTPTNPSQVGSFNDTSNSDLNGIHVSGDYAYIATSHDLAELAIMNISTPSSPSLAGYFNAAGTADANEVFVQGSTAYLVRNSSASPEFYIIDVSTPSSPASIGSLNIAGNLNDVYVPSGSNYAFIGSDLNNQEFQVIDIGTPSSPSVYSVLDLNGDANGIFVDNDIVYLATENSSSELQIAKRASIWSVASDQVNSGSYALKAAPITTSDRWLTANNLDETDLLLEAYWYFDDLSAIDTAQSFRTSASTPINQYETNLEGNSGWDIAKEIGGNWTEIASNAGTPANNTWTKITTVIDGTNMKVLQDSSQIVPAGGGWTNVGSELTAGSIGFRAWNIAGGSNWWIDDVKARKYTEPEPSTSLASEESAGYPTDKPTINPISSYNPASVDSWTTFAETANKNGGEIYYQISDDDGATWYYWDGSNWSAAGSSDYNTADVINTNLWQFSTANKKIMFKAFLESDGSQFVQLDEISVGCANLQLETGSVNTDENWVTVNMANTYASPIVVASYYESNNTLPASVRIRNLDSDSFEIRLQNPSGSDLSSDEITYFVIEEGKWNINGVKVEASKYDTNTVGSSAAWNYDTQSFGQNFTSDPIVLHQVMTNNDSNWITTYVSRIDSRTNPPDINGMRIALNGAEATSSHGTETIGWIAIDKDQTNNISGVNFETYRTSDSVKGHDNGCYAFNYQNTYGSPPLVLGFQEEMDGNNGGWSVTCNNTATQASFHIEEDQVADSERRHITETDSFIAFAQAFSYSSGGGGGSGYATLGTLESSAFNAGSSSSFNIIEWDEVPYANGSIKLQIKTAPDNGGAPGAWSATWCGPDGEDGDETDYFTVSSGEVIHPDHNGDQWIKYLVTITGDGAGTPILEEVRFYYVP